MTLWTVAHQAPLSMVFLRQEYWNGLPLPSPGYFPDPGIEPRFRALHSSLVFTNWATKEAHILTSLTYTPSSQYSSHLVLIGGYSECIYQAPIRCQALSQAQEIWRWTHRAPWAYGAPFQRPSQNRMISGTIKLGIKCYKALRRCLMWT